MKDFNLIQNFTGELSDNSFISLMEDKPLEVNPIIIKSKKEALSAFFNTILWLEKWPQTLMMKNKENGSLVLLHFGDIFMWSMLQ